jgi:LmbE family N-acetylglucosaminyl deacetylase
LIKTKRVFIFAHCDDELFCLPLLLDKQVESTVIFLTTLKREQTTDAKVNIRQQEALRANQFLSRFGNIKTLFFSGTIFDGSIHTDFDSVKFDELTQIVLDEEPSELVTLSYEAGHQDHDSVELITRILAKNLSIKMRCFSGYRASAISPRLFLVLKPTDAIEKVPFNRFLSVLTSIRLMLIYKSQSKAWIGLAPPLLFKYAFSSFREERGSFSLDPEKKTNCFYQNRGRALQSEVLSAHQKFVRNFVSPGK